MVDEVVCYRCQTDGRYTLMRTQDSMRPHLGHHMRPIYPPWWVRWLIRFGWRP
jgi:hypothetical protein